MAKSSDFQARQAATAETMAGTEAFVAVVTTADYSIGDKLRKTRTDLAGDHTNVLTSWYNESTQTALTTAPAVTDIKPWGQATRVPLGAENINITAAPIGLTVPAKANLAEIQLFGGNADGTGPQEQFIKSTQEIPDPVNAIGDLENTFGKIELEGEQELAGFQIRTVSATPSFAAKANVKYAYVHGGDGND